MKNIITIATLLAAGTAFANADVTTWDQTPKSNISATNIATWTPSDKLLWNNNNSFVFTVDAASLKDSFSGTLFTIDYTTPNTSNQNNFEAFTGVTLSNDELTLVSWRKQKTTASFTAESVTKDLTFVFNVNNGTLKLSVYGDGNFNNELATINKSSVGSFTTTSAAIVFGGVSSAGATQYDQYITSETSSFALYAAGYVAGGSPSASDLSKYYASIPEPSAFGLLAGLGALALVGARRRRR